VKLYILILILFFGNSLSQNINHLIEKYKSIISNTNNVKIKGSDSDGNLKYQKTIKKFISEDEYILGPNDILEIYINSSENSDMYEKKINLSGYIVLPYYGKILLKGKTIKMAEKEIEIAVEKKKSDVNVDISINGFREFSILVKWGFY